MIHNAYKQTIHANYLRIVKQFILFYLQLIPITLLDNLTTTNVTTNAAQPKSLPEIIIISFIVAILILVTAGGNLMVMISFKMDKQLQTVSNYFLLSLSVADFAIGVVSMPLYTVYLLMDEWPIGAWVCDTWLSLDYTMSNASVANLLLISFDRYFSVTRPLTYRAKRTPRRAAIMISTAWIVSILMWTPWIFAWPFIEGKRTIPEGECYIQFLVTNSYLTVITAVAAFYLPVAILCGLYYKIYLETEKRQRSLAQLQGGNKQVKRPRKSTEFSDDENHGDFGNKLSDSSPDSEHEKLPISSNNSANVSTIIPRLWQRCKSCCKVDRENDVYVEESSSSDNHGGSPLYDGTPSSTTSRNILSLKRDTSLDNHVASNNSSSNGKLCHRHQGSTRTRYNSGTMVPLITVDSTKSTPVNTPSTDVTGTFSRYSNLSSATATTLADSPSIYSTAHQKTASHSDTRDHSGDTYTILIKLPAEDSEEGTKPTIRMLSDSEGEAEVEAEADAEEETLLSDVNDIPMTNRRHTNATPSCHVVEPPTCPQCQLAFGSIYQDPSSSKHGGGQSTDSLRMAMQAKVAARLASKVRNQRTRRKKQEQKQDKKAVKTLSAILLAFVVTWTPYNIFTLVETFGGTGCINPTLYSIGKFIN